MEQIKRKYEAGLLTIAGAVYDIIASGEKYTQVEMAKFLGCTSTGVSAAAAKLESQGLIRSNMITHATGRNKVYEIA